jgi:hypothetical protein
MTNEIQKLKDAAKRAGMSSYFVDGKLRADMLIIGSDFIDRLYEEITKSCLNLTALAASGGNAAPGLTDDELYEFWLHRDCMGAIRAGDMRFQFISAARAAIAASDHSAALVAALQNLLKSWDNEEKKPGWVKRFQAAKDQAHAALSAAGVKGD